MKTDIAMASHMHNVVANDGTPPDEFRASARRQLAAYGSVTLRSDRILDVEALEGAFRLTSACAAVIEANVVILATGVRDELPAIDGLDDLWGDLVAACPFCPRRGRPGRSPVRGDRRAPAGRRGPTRGRWRGGSPRGRVDRTRRGPLRRHHPAPAGAVRRAAGSGARPSGCVRVDELGRTSHPGVFAAGDLAHLPGLPMPMASVVMAAAAGQLAASAALATTRAVG